MIALSYDAQSAGQNVKIFFHHGLLLQRVVRAVAGMAGRVEQEQTPSH
jgi:hypothetical protein